MNPPDKGRWSLQILRKRDGTQLQRTANLSLKALRKAFFQATQGEMVSEMPRETEVRVWWEPT